MHLACNHFIHHFLHHPTLVTRTENYSITPLTRPFHTVTQLRQCPMLARTQQIWLFSRRSAVKIDMNSKIRIPITRVVCLQMASFRPPTDPCFSCRTKARKEKKAWKKQTQQTRLRKFLMPLISVRPKCCLSHSGFSHIVSHVYIVHDFVSRCKLPRPAVQLCPILCKYVHLQMTV